ncbi:hypothetical protein SESBI_06248 [Sesbania bispinosa]|nr:hypothetical protein SESBI_06248 [Sesbania bispinosa]
MEAPLDNDDTFTDFIRRSKYKIRTITMSKSNVGWEQSHPAPAPAIDEGSNSKENQKDQFSEFIQLAKKKLRTTSSIGNNSSFKRG